jgi:methionyl aminopeptidase
MLLIHSNDACWCGSSRKYKRCHGAPEARVRPGHVTPMRAVADQIPRPDYASTGAPVRRTESPVKSADVVDRMRRAGKAAAEVLGVTGAAVAPGVTTEELDVIAHETYVALGGYPSTINYHGFPKSICTSVNEVICHGIPDDRPLRDGDIVNVDVTIFLDGVHGDTSATYLVGDVDRVSRRLVDVTRQCLDVGIAAVKPGVPIRAIGAAIQKLAESHHFGVVRVFTGHGIGEQFHTEPTVPHYDAPSARTIMEAGMVFTIEPMLTIGSPRELLLNDGWTAVTVDGGRSAQFEHMILVVDDGAEILTA